MTQSEIIDCLWKRIEALIPKRRRSGKKAGRPPVDDKVAFEAIVFALKTGTPWRYISSHQFGCSGMTAWRRLRHWKRTGVWDRVYWEILEQRQRAGKISWDWGAVDSSSVRALKGGPKTGKNPTDRGRLGTKYHVLVDAHGVPLAARITGANRHDVTQIMDLVRQVPPLRGKRGRPRRRLKAVFADRAYDSEAVRESLRALGIQPYLAKRNTEHGSGLGKFRWVVERTFAWIHGFRRLRIRYERLPSIHEAFLVLAMSIVCLHFLLR